MLKKLSFIYKIILDALKSNKVENFLLSLVFLLSVILLFTQIGMVSDYIRPYVSDIEVFEGQYINEIDSLIKEGTITLQLIDMEKEKDIKILVNGNVVGCFDKKNVDIKVRNNSVVEIDGTKLKSSVRVKIISKSSNIKSDIINKQVTVKSNIEMLCRIKLK